MDKTHQIQLDIKLKSPVLVSENVGDENMIGTLDYISGTTLRGVFASLFISTKKEGILSKLEITDDEFSEFADFFLSGALTFLNAYPTGEKTTRLLPIPRSIEYEKTKSERVFDFMFTNRDEHSGENEAEARIHPTKYKQGYCRLDKNGTGITINRTVVAKQYQIHHKRTNQRVGRSANSEIFNYESILGEQNFSALILGSETALQNFRNIIFPSDGEKNEKNGAANQITIRLGRSKNTQYGRAVIKINNVEPFVSEAESASVPENNTKTSLTFISDVILVDENGVSKIDKKLLEQSLGLDPGDIKHSYVRSRTVESYVAAWKARTPSYNAYEKGSCFEIEWPKDVAKKNKLLSIAKNGLGIKTNEGFGRIILGWQTGQLDPNKPDKSAEEINIPEEKVSIVRPYFRRLVEARLAAYIKAEAAKLVTEFVAEFEKNKTAPTSTQLHKLRHFVLKEKNFTNFKKNILTRIEKNRNAADRLRNVRTPKGTLLEFISKDHVRDLLKNMKNPEPGEKKFLDIIEYNKWREKDELQSKLFIKFYDTFFTLLDKRLKPKGIAKREEKK